MFKLSKLNASLVASLALLATFPAWSAEGQTAYSFAGSPDGKAPASGLLAVGNKYYGVTGGGGHLELGTIYELSRKADGSWSEKTVFSFGGLDNGSMPQAGLIADKAGRLYGTTYLGGNLGAGTVFRLSPNADGSWTQTVLHHFTGGAAGYHPYSDLVIDAKGRIIGTTFEGGENGDGTAFVLTPAAGGSWTFETVHHFNETMTDGAGPRGKLATDDKGVVFGITTAGGSSFAGTLWALYENKKGWQFKLLDSFDNSTGRLPTGGVTLGTDGALYGTAMMGGANTNGTIFRAARGKGGVKITAIHDFDNNEGWFPYSTVLRNAKTGALYATTSGGGASSGGSVVELLPQADGAYSSSVLWSVSGGTGTYSGVTATKAGELLGTTRFGGASFAGQVYVVKP